MEKDSNQKVKMMRPHNSPPLSAAMFQSMKGVSAGKRGRLWRRPGPAVTGSPAHFPWGLGKVLTSLLWDSFLISKLQIVAPPSRVVCEDQK